MKKYSLVSLFTGAGGMDLGFHNEGFDILYSNDFDKDACNTYNLNFQRYSKNNFKPIDFRSIYEVKSSDLPKNVDVLIGGFPCQGFSIANNKRSINDQRNSLYKEMIRIIRITNPKVFVGENVKGILSLDKGNYFKQIIKDFKSLGYKVDYKLLTATDFNVPQNRQRIVIIANKIGAENAFPKPYRINNLTTKNAIGFLQNVELSNEPIKLKNKIIYNHVASESVKDHYFKRKYDLNQEEICDYLNYWLKKSTISKKEINKILGYSAKAEHWFRKDNNSGTIPGPEDWLSLKKILKFDNKYDKKVTTYVLKKITFEQSLRITNWDSPSDTITASNPEIHINKKRRLSVRECAIIQTFPDDFIFTGSLNSMYRQVGNAVPVKMAEAIAKTVKEILKNE